MSERKEATKLDDAEAAEIAALCLLDRADLTPEERHLAEQIYDLTSQLTGLMENGPDPEFKDHPSHQTPET